MKSIITTAMLLIAAPALAGQPNVRATTAASPILYSVWAFQLTAGQWVKDEKYSWTTSDPRAALEYTRKVNAVPGSCTTTNSPQPVVRTIRLPYFNLTIRIPPSVWKRSRRRRCGHYVEL